MARKTARLIAAALLACTFAVQAQPRDPATLKTPQTPWYRLSPEERRTIEAAYLLELTHEEVAQKLSLPLGTESQKVAGP